MPCQILSEPQHHPADFDQSLLQQAAQSHTCAAISAVWQAQQSLVVPRTYRRFARFTSTCQHSATKGWPVIVRQSGGGLVPQGGGILNFSWAQKIDGPALSHTEHIYQTLCRIVAQALAQLGIQSTPSAVPGSFCDGRYNLAVQTASGLRKIAGTAQCWQRIRPTPESSAVQVMLAHAVILADLDTTPLIQHLNTFEQTLGSPTRYQTHSVIAARALTDQEHLMHALQQALSMQACAHL